MPTKSGLTYIQEKFIQLLNVTNSTQPYMPPPFDQTTKEYVPVIASVSTASSTSTLYAAYARLLPFVTIIINIL